ncbi:MAG: PQQ-dependent sugar dehydrogenase, partial [Actinomycetota bacterium]|nr:PQQ-dependent sugar dehydrogenase [Actinomycetota bacterium]
MTSSTTASHRARPLRRIFLAVTLALVVLASASSAQAATLPEGFSESQYVSGLARPYQMEFAPDGRLFVTQQGGKLRVVKDGALLTQPFLTVPVDTAGDRGLIGVAFDPNFETNKYVYVYYTATTPTIHNRVSRFKANGDVAVPGSEEVLMDFETLGTSTTHNGGSIHFGPDGKLYIVTGENAQQGGTVAQSMNSLLGKMLRINADGSIPEDNPFYTTATGKYRAIYASGLRNPFTFAIEPGTGRSFINDVGAKTWEEINEARAGANYGWPETEGMTSDPRFQSPLHAYGHDFTDTTGCAITGGAFYTTPNSQFPAEYRGDYFFSDYCTGWIRRLDADNGYAPQAFATGVEGPIDMKVGPDGSLYYLTRQDGVPGNPGMVHRVQYSGKPAISEQPRDVTVAPQQAATFTARASGKEPLRYQWQRDGVDIPGATSASYTLSDPTAADDGARFRVVVTNDQGSATSNEAALTVTTNKPPEATVVTPEEGTKYNAGTRVSFAGGGTDPEDGTLPASAFEWDIAFHHNEHSHPGPNVEPGETGDGRSGSVVIPDEGETDEDVFYRIRLTVTDSAGQKHSTYRDIKPNLATITLRATPESDDDGPQVTLDGQPVRTPYATPSVVGVKRVIGAVSPQTLDAKDYIFDAWSDGGAATHDVVTPATDSTYTAAYRIKDDVDPPDTTIGPSTGVTNDSTPEFTFSSNESGSTFECKVDGGAFEPCSSPTTLPTQADGQHVFYVRAVNGGRT